MSDEHRDEEDREQREETILNEETAGAWVDSSSGSQSPPLDDLPEQPPTSAGAPGGVWARILRALRGR